MCCVGTGLCEGLGIRSEISYQVCVCVYLCLIVRDLKPSAIRRPKSDLGCRDTGKKEEKESTKLCHVEESEDLQLTRLHAVETQIVNERICVCVPYANKLH